MEVQNIKLDDLIIVGEYQARPDQPGVELEELAQSIKIRGLLQPISVVPSQKSPGKYEIIMGQRRFLAFRMLGKTEIPAIITKPKEDAIEYLIDSVTENVQRRDTSYEQNKAVCVKLWLRFKSVKAIIDITGLSESFVRKHIKWASLSPKLKELVDNGTVKIETAAKASEVAALDDDNPSEEDVVQLALNMSKLTQSQQNAIKQTKKKNTAAKTEEIIQKVVQENQVPIIPISLTHSAYDILKKYARANDKTEAEAASDIVEDAMQQQNVNDND